MKPRSLRVWAGVVLFAMSVVAAQAESRGEKPMSVVVSASNGFGLDLYGRLREKPGNLFFSPVNISMAFAMAYGGAEGETEAQMAKVLHLAGDEAAVHQGFAALREQWKPGEKPSYQLQMANRLWGQEDYRFLDAYLKLTERYYGAGLKQLDFKRNPDQARSEINRWVEQQTQDKIKDLMPQGSITRDTRLVLTSAIYFLGTWFHTFESDSTREVPFHLAAGGEVRVPMMQQNNRFRYGEADGLKLLEMPYKGSRLTMVVLLPEKRDGLPGVEKNLSPDKLNAWLEKLEARQVQVGLPKFKLTSDFSLNETLKSLGMTAAFDPNRADFSGMTGNKELFISDAVHKAYVDVNEQGTEAAAATGIAVGVTSIGPPPAEFRADHPFLFLIRDMSNGAILFFGRMEDPSK